MKYVCLFTTLSALAGGAVDASALGSFQCSYQMECIHGEACSETDFDATVSIAQPISTISTVFGDFGGNTIIDLEQTIVQATLPQRNETFLFHQLEGGKSSFTVNYPLDSILIQYFGTCEADQ